ncbi:hypothetical protein JA9_004149 [Meyerozyma sp. JA9]|nr:hypothetical protein JA9_004149 [Meyerozyma sp. JA9]
MDVVGGQDLNGAFKVINLAVAVLAFILGLYIVVFGGVIGLLGSTQRRHINPEFRVPPEAQTYASFLFSFIGRGICKFNVDANIVYTLIGAIINGASVFRVIAGILIFMVGLVYIALEMVPSISPPDNMNLDGVAIAGEDVI